MATAGGGGGASGIQLTVTFNNGDSLALERDTSSGFGSAVTIATLTGGTQVYSDPLPVDGITYYYRAKVSRTGYVASAYSGTVSAKPVVFGPN